MGNSSEDYIPLVGDADDALHSKQPSRGLCLREKLLILVVVLQALALGISPLVYSIAWKKPAQAACPLSDQSLLYSPAQDAVEYQVKSFTVGKEHRTIYQGASPEVDRAWGGLYNNTIMKIPRDEAALLPNKTYPIQDEPGYYLAGLDVFHQLHCLNAIRRALYKDYYQDPDLVEEHVSHCVDAIRQSLMCSADISVNVWQWSAAKSHVVGYSTQAHTCRNFEKIRDFARARRVHKWIDTKLFVQDDLPSPPIIS